MLKIDHIGYAVKRMEKAILEMEALGFHFGKMINDPERKIRVAFGIKDGYRVELISPTEKGSPVDGVLNIHGPSPYHICYKTYDFDKDIEILTNRGGIALYYSRLRQ